VGLVAGPVDLAFGLVAGAVDVAFGLVAGAVDVAFGLGREAVALGALGREAGAAVSATAGRATRLSLRRCGRRCGSAERTSEEEEEAFRSVITGFERCGAENPPDLETGRYVERSSS
jgi:hypothetical protein